MSHQRSIVHHFFPLNVQVLEKSFLRKSCSISKNFFLKKFFTRTCTLKGENAVQLIFDDSYICYVSKIDVFKVVLC